MSVDEHIWFRVLALGLPSREVLHVTAILEGFLAHENPPPSFDRQPGEGVAHLDDPVLAEGREDYRNSQRSIYIHIYMYVRTYM